MNTPTEHAALIQQEREKYERVWQEPLYRDQSPAWRSRNEISFLLRASLSADSDWERKTIADYGCGTGQLAAAFLAAGHIVKTVDIADNAMLLPTHDNLHRYITPLHLMPIEAASDVAYCVDVMEHVPPELVWATLHRMSQCCQGKVYFRIARFPDHFGQTLGVGHLHLSLFPHQVWEDYLTSFWREVVTVLNGPCEYHGGEVSCFVVDKPRKAPTIKITGDVLAELS